MKLYVYVFVAMLAMAVPSHALLGAKLALLGALKNSFGAGGGGGGYGNGGAYGYNGYGGGYGRGYANGGYNRPVYTGQSYNYGWGQQNYGGGYSSGGFNDGTDGNVRIIKVIVNREQPETYYDNYARSSIASGISGSSSASWAPLPVQVQTGVPAPAPVQVIQPPSRPVYVQPQVQPGYQHVTAQRPIQYSGLQPQPLLQGQQPVSTIRLIVDGSAQHVPAASYGPPVPATNLVAPSADSTGDWSSTSSVSGWNNVGSGPWKNGGIWESIGC